jgi:methyl-accepting chemotaxis protein
VAISGRVAAALAEIVVKARDVDTLVAEIAHASQEQSQGIAQVNTAVSQMDRVTQSNAAAAEESASAAEELNAQASMLTREVRSLLALVGSTTAAAAATTPVVASPPAPTRNPARGRGQPGGKSQSRPAPQVVVHAPDRQEDASAVFFN